MLHAECDEVTLVGLTVILCARLTQVTDKAEAVVAKTLAEVTAKVGAAAKNLAEKEKESRKVRRGSVRVEAVLAQKMRSRTIKLTSRNRKLSEGHVVKKGIVKAIVNGANHLLEWQR